MLSDQEQQLFADLGVAAAAELTDISYFGDDILQYAMRGRYADCLAALAVSSDRAEAVAVMLAACREQWRPVADAIAAE